MTTPPPAPTTWRRGAHEISTDLARLDFDVVHGFLTTSYWSPGIPRDVVERAARHSLAFGVYDVAEGASRVTSIQRRSPCSSGCATITSMSHRASPRPRCDSSTNTSAR